MQANTQALVPESTRTEERTRKKPKSLNIEELKNHKRQLTISNWHAANWLRMGTIQGNEKETNGIHAVD